MNAEQLAQALGAVRSRRQWKCRCIAHEDRSPSMIIFDGRESVQVRCMAGCEPEDIIAVLRSRGLWDGMDRIGYHRGDLDTKSVSRETLSDKREHQLRMLARYIFDDAQPIAGTLAQKYFDSRAVYSALGDDGFDVLDEWSAQSEEKYPGRRHCWRLWCHWRRYTVDCGNGRRPISVGTLFYFAETGCRS